MLLEVVVMVRRRVMMIRKGGRRRTMTMVEKTNLPPSGPEFRTLNMSDWMDQQLP